MAEKPVPDWPDVMSQSGRKTWPCWPDPLAICNEGTETSHSVFSRQILKEEIDNPRMRGRKLCECALYQYRYVEEIDNPRMRGRKRVRELLGADSIPEEIDNPRMRGRKPITVTPVVSSISKKLIIPGCGDGNTTSFPLTWP